MCRPKAQVRNCILEFGGNYKNFFFNWSNESSKYHQAEHILFSKCSWSWWSWRFIAILESLCWMWSYCESNFTLRINICTVSINLQLLGFIPLFRWIQRKHSYHRQITKISWNSFFKQNSCSRTPKEINDPSE